jgi:hypothetical protein
MSVFLTTFGKSEFRGTILAPKNLLQKIDSMYLIGDFKRENFVRAEYFRNEHFVSKLAYLNDIFEEFSTLNASLQGSDTSIAVMTDKMRAFIGELGLWVRKLEGKRLEIFSRLNDFVEENSVETCDTGID